MILDIGHSTKDRGASSPDGKLSETAFQHKNAGEVKRLIDAAGYRCMVCNRGIAPTQEPLASYAKAAGMLHLNKPDKGGVCYPSKYFPDRIGAGMIGADKSALIPQSETPPLMTDVFSQHNNLPLRVLISGAGIFPA